MANDTFTVERTTVIGAPPSAILPHLENFHRWVAWSPWEGMDPNLARTYTGPESGVGAFYAWSGTRKVGQGNMRVTESKPDRIALDLNFLKPFKASNTAVFTLVPENGATRVTWTMSGKKNLFSKVMGIFMNMDKLVGKDFEKGLASLKSVVESNPASNGAGS